MHTILNGSRIYTYFVQLKLVDALHKIFDIFCYLVQSTLIFVTLVFLFEFLEQNMAD